MQNILQDIKSILPCLMVNYISNSYRCMWNNRSMFCGGTGDTTISGQWMYSFYNFFYPKHCYNMNKNNAEVSQNPAEDMIIHMANGDIKLNFQTFTSLCMQQTAIQMELLVYETQIRVWILFGKMPLTSFDFDKIISLKGSYNKTQVLLQPKYSKISYQTMYPKNQLWFMLTHLTNIANSTQERYSSKQTGGYLTSEIWTAISYALNLVKLLHIWIADLQVSHYHNML